jgi:hypothetical protein
MPGNSLFAPMAKHRSVRCGQLFTSDIRHEKQPTIRNTLISQNLRLQVSLDYQNILCDTALHDLGAIPSPCSPPFSDNLATSLKKKPFSRPFGGSFGSNGEREPLS